MFGKLFAEGGLSLDRLRALLQVSAGGSIVKAAGGDPVRQSQFSRQIKELENFFQIKLVERHGKGIQLTARGRELARISRFFLLGLAQFRRGCLSEEQTFRIGAGATMLDRFLLPAIVGAANDPTGPRYAVERVSDDEVERRLHDLTLDFGIVTRPNLSRPLQLKAVGGWRLFLWTPRKRGADESRTLADLKARRLPLVLPVSEMPTFEALADYPARLTCQSFIETRALLSKGTMAAFLPDFLTPERECDFTRMQVGSVTKRRYQFHFAWNPRLLRLNPPAIKARDSLISELTKRMSAANA